MKKGRLSAENLGSPLRENLEAIVKTCLAELPADCRVESVVLSGGFARGEVGHYSLSGRAVPLGQYPLEWVLSRPVLDSEIEPIHRRLREELSFLPVDDPGSRNLEGESQAHRVLDLRFKTVDEFRRRSPDLGLYDLQRSYRILHGGDAVASLQPTSLDEISPFSPWQILTDQIVLAMKFFDLDYLDRPPTSREALEFRRAVCRTLLDLAGFIGFLYRSYRTDYAGRIEFLKSNQGLWRTWLSDPEAFVARIESAAHFIRQPVFEEVSSEQVLAEWFDLVYDLGRVSPHLINLVLLTQRVSPADLARTLELAGEAGKKAGSIADPFRENWAPLVAIQLRSYPGLFFRDSLRFALRRDGRNLPFETFLCTQASRYYGAVEHFLWRGRKWVLKNLRRSLLSPPAFQAAVLPLILFSLSPQLEVREEALAAFNPLMEPYMPMPFDFLPPQRRWEATKRCFVHEMLDYRAKR